MDLSWDDLNMELLDCDPAKELDWCRKEQLEYSTPARLAHYIVCWRELTATASDQVPEEHSGVLDEYQRMPLPKPSDPVERWRELLEWRHPRMDLNLLQLAVIFDAPFCINYLSQPIFMRAGNYRDEKSVLVNHPLHLACRLGCCSILLIIIWSLPDEVFPEEGIVDLSQARIQRLPSPENKEISNAVDPSDKGTPARSTVNVSAANENELLALMGRNNAMVSQISRGLTPTVGTCFSLTAEDDNMCVSHLLMHPLDKLSAEYEHPQSSTVEYLWKTVGFLCRRGVTVECFAVLMHSLSVDVAGVCRSIMQSRQFPDTSEEDALSSETYCSEVTMLACQLASCVAESTGSWADSLEALYHLFVDMVDSVAVESVEKPASYLPRKHLSSIVRTLQKQHLRNRDPQFALAMNMFTYMAKETNLQNLCMLKILESVRGDARAARNLSALPEPLRKRFHVPFQVLYDRLTAESA